jgi:hypothetical protein
MWGPVIVGGTYFVQRGSLSPDAVLISVPFGLLVALVLLANNLRDIDYDRSAGSRPWGRSWASRRPACSTKGLFSWRILL